MVKLILKRSRIRSNKNVKQSHGFRKFCNHSDDNDFDSAEYLVDHKNSQHSITNNIARIIDLVPYVAGGDSAKSSQFFRPPVRDASEIPVYNTRGLHPRNVCLLKHLVR